MDAQDDREDVSRGQSRYSAQDLAGLKVEHDMERFQEGRDVILTLKDQCKKVALAVLSACP